MRWKIATGSSRFTLNEHATELSALLRSTGEIPWLSVVGTNAGAFWHTWGYKGSTATLQLNDKSLLSSLQNEINHLAKIRKPRGSNFFQNASNVEGLVELLLFEFKRMEDSFVIWLEVYLFFKEQSSLPQHRPRRKNRAQNQQFHSYKMTNPPGIGLHEDRHVVGIRGGPKHAHYLAVVLHDVQHLAGHRGIAVGEQRHQQRHIVDQLDVRADLVYASR